MNSIKWAFKFGRLEHIASRLVFAFLVLTYISYIIKTYGFEVKSFMDFIFRADLTEWLLRATIILWIAYWSFHQLEKAAFKGK